MAIIVFFCKDSKAGISEMEYYQQDIQALRELGHEVVICNRYGQIPPRFDLMYIWWWSYALWPVLLARSKGKRSIITGVFNFRHEQPNTAHDYFSRPLWQRILLKRALMLADLNLFISELETSECKNYFRTDRIWHFPCSVGQEYHQDEVPARTLGLFNICWSGTLNLRRKGVYDILDAVRLLADQGQPVHVTLAGKKGDGHGELLAAVKARSLDSHVTLLGEISKAEKLKLLASIEVYVQPSYFEGFGLATAEAMASGACVITCDVGEVKNVVGDCAVYVTPGNIPELAAAIKRVLSDGVFRKEMQQRARHRMRERFSYGTKVQSLRAALAHVGIR